ncbi:MAG: RluA family pseudouridine synthase [Alphaproteobacteria bacterium]|nr:RluA family pseudouridine synthase [Alphaproteobacteria bacterium]
MSEVKHIKVTADEDGQRLGRWLKKHAPEIPYGLAQKIIRDGQLRVDGKRVKTDARLQEGQDVRIPPVQGSAGPRRASMPHTSYGDKATDLLPPVGMSKSLPRANLPSLASMVIYDDGEVIALNKPAGLAVQGGTKTRDHVDGMLDELTGKNGVRPRLVHRLDKDTSGVLLLARSASVAKKLGELFKGQDVEKTYWAIVAPVPEIREGTIRAPLIKAGGKDKERVIVDDKEGKHAVTDYAVIDEMHGQAAFIAFRPRTGRTHQIRVHAASVLECPVLGDWKYGVRRSESLADMEKIANTLHLHARRIVLPHPARPGMLEIEAPLPPVLAESWKALGFNPSFKGRPFKGGL